MKVSGKHCCEATTRKLTKVAGMLRSGGRLLGLFGGSGGSLLGRHDVVGVWGNSTEAGDSGDMVRVTINSVVGGVGSWDVRRWWYRGRARGGAFHILYSSAAFTITRAERQALSPFRNEKAQHKLHSCAQTRFFCSVRYWTGWNCIFAFASNNVVSCMCTRVSPFERDSSAGLRRPAWLDQLSLYFITHGATVSLLAQVHSRLVYLMGMRVQPSIAVSVSSQPPQSLAPRRPPRFSERSAAHLLLALSRARSSHHCTPGLVFNPSPDMCDG
jgi:hypothetical protein